MPKAAGLGPGVLVAAAFVGPGTVTAATLAGAQYGYALGWGIVLSTLATLVLQEMALRLGVVGRVGLGEAMRRSVPAGWPRAAVAVLVVAAIFVGNAAYEGGNLAGATAGAGLLTQLGPRGSQILTLGLAAGSAALLWRGGSGLLQGLLAALVAGMAAVYLLAVALIGPDLEALLAGLLPLRLPTGAELTVMALIGTTVVPYNLFLHAGAARRRYASADELGAARRDSAVSILLGGLVTLAIASLAAAAFAGDARMPAQEVSTLVAPLRAALGEGGAWLAPATVGLGYLAAGFSSAVTAPLAAAYALAGLFGWGGGDAAAERDRRFRGSWAAVLVAGVAFAVSGLRPVPLIFVAQVANGLLLPVVASLLVYAANDRGLLGEAVNGRVRNLLAVATVLVALALGAPSLWRVFA